MRLHSPIHAVIKRFFFLLIIFVSICAHSQEKGYLEFAGRTAKDGKGFGGATVALFKGSQKLTELKTGKSGKFSFDLDLGVDYKVVFNAPDCAEMYLIIYGSKCPAEKSIFPIYEIDVPFFELGKTTINYTKFKSPLTKIVYDGKKSFRDDEQYVLDYTKDLFLDPAEEMRKLEEKLALEKSLKEKEMLEKIRFESEDKARQENIALAKKKSDEEALALKKLMEEANKLEKKNGANNEVTKKENESNQSMVSAEIKLTLEKEQKKIKEKQNKAIKATFENDLLKIVALNERANKEVEFKKAKETAYTNEVIESLKRDAITKAESDNVRFSEKIKAKQTNLNRQLKNKEIETLVKNVAYNERNMKADKITRFPDPAMYKPKSILGITTELETQTFKSVYTVNVFEGKSKTTYRKEKFNWGMVYYYKNNIELTELDYKKEVSLLNVPL